MQIELRSYDFNLRPARVFPFPLAGGVSGWRVKRHEPIADNGNVKAEAVQ